MGSPSSLETSVLLRTFGGDGRHNPHRSGASRCVLMVPRWARPSCSTR